MMALEMGSFQVLKPIIDKLILRGIVTDWFLHCDSAMRIAPPLVISIEELHLACDTILEVLEEGQ
jgi:acetylornithine/succinyldiaminopimelate/putrescine aminotransferase